MVGSLTQREFLRQELPGFMQPMAPVIADHAYVINPVLTWWNPNVGNALMQDGIGLVTGQRTVDQVLQEMDAAWKQGPSLGRCGADAGCGRDVALAVVELERPLDGLVGFGLVAGGALHLGQREPDARLVSGAQDRARPQARPPSRASSTASAWLTGVCRDPRPRGDDEGGITVAGRGWGAIDFLPVGEVVRRPPPSGPGRSRGGQAGRPR